MSFSPYFLLGVALACFTAVAANNCAQNKQLSTSKLICYYSTVEDVNGCYCTHVILPANSDVKAIEKLKERARGAKVYVSVNEFNQGLIDLLKTHKIDGLEVDLKKLDAKNDISDFISTIRTKIGADLDVVLSVPAKADLLAKYFDFKGLSKHVDLFVLQTAFVGASGNVTFHPSRLSGMWDVQNTDSVVDLVSGLGAPLSKLVIAVPVQAFQFTLQSEEFTAPGSPALELQTITRNELCKLMRGNQNWTLERDEDQAGPYIFSKNRWIAFEDPKSIDIKVKYSKIRGLAGVALKDLNQDGADCGSTILEATYTGLSRQARAPRGAVLHSLEREIVDGSSKALDSAVQLSPYKISRIIDTEGKIHVVRQDTRTEFQCSRQGYFVHPRSCNRFYRCVKFDQLSDDYNVFEFDCPAGLAFDERVEVCVWPGSLPHGTPCSGSSEIAPVPRQRFACPSAPGYYADPENCRWFFACLDHGKSPLSAYEFRCPYGLVFDAERLVCEWPWLVPKCFNGLDSEYYVKGPQSAGVILETYNGLGQLGALKLGGLSGKIEKPIATLYSNVIGQGSSGLHYQASQALENAGLLRVNNGAGLVLANQYDGQYGQGANAQHGVKTGLNEGSVLINAGQYQGVSDGQSATLQGAQYGATTGFNEGSVLIDAGHQYQGESGQYDQSANLQGGLNEGSVLINAGQYQGESGQHGQSTNAQYGTTTGLNEGSVLINAAGQYQGESGQYDQSANLQGRLNEGSVLINAGQYQGLSGQYDQSATLQGANTQHGATTGFKEGSVLINAGQYQEASGQYDHAANSNVYQGANIKLVQDGVAGQQTTSSVLVNSGQFDQSANLHESNVHSVQNADVSNQAIVHNLEAAKHNGQLIDYTGAVSSQILARYQLDAEIAKRIKIIGGGYSIVGPPPNLDDIPVDENGVPLASRSPAFVSISRPAPVSAFPGIKSVSSFETVQGGVIANVPEFQFKVQSLEDAGLFANISKNFANFVIAAPASETAIRDQLSSGLKAALNPAKSFVSVTTDHNYVSSTAKPAIIVQQPNFDGHEPSSVLQPQIVISSPRPAVIVEHQPQVVVSSTPATYSYKNNNAAIISKFSIRKPSKVIVEDYTYQKQPVVPLYQQPQLLSTYTYQKQPLTQYTYQSVAQNSAIKPDVHAYSYQPTGGSYQYVNIQNKQQESNAYSKPQIATYQYSTPQPSVTFEETPSPKPAQVTSYFNIQNSGEAYASTPKPVDIQQPSYFNNANTDKAQHQTVGYTYPKPEVKFEEAALVQSTPKPAVVTSYYNTGSTKAAVEQQNVGYAYPRPEVKFEEGPVVYTTPKPAVTSYYNTGSTKAIVEQQNIGYAYPRPEVKFEESPVVYSTPKPVQPAVVTSYYYNTGATKADSDTIIEQQNIGYSNPRPKIKFEEAAVAYSTPKPVQPAVVTSYFNTGSTKVDSDTVVEQQNVGYSYPRPQVEFEEAAVVYSTPKPAVLTSYYNSGSTEAVVDQQNIGYAYPRPEVKFEESPVVHSTPKPVQPAVVTSYYYNTGSTKADSHSVVEQQNIGYSYPRPQIKFEEAAVVYSTPKPVQPAIVTSYYNTGSTKAVVDQQNIGYAYPRPEAKFEEAPVVYSTPKPIQPAVVSSHYNTGSAKDVVEQKNIGYSYPRPQVKFEETAVVYSTPKPVQPAVVTSYYNTGSTKADSHSVVEQQNIGYSYTRPQVKFEEAAVVYSTPKPVQPTVVTSYYNVGSKADSESVVQQQNTGYTFFRPEVKAPVDYATQYVPSSTPQPAVISSYFNIGSSTSKPVTGYDYPQPDVKFEEGYSYPQEEIKVKPRPSYIGSTSPRPNVVEEAPRPAVVSSYFNLDSSKGYNYPKQAVHFEAERQPVQEVPFVKKTAYVTGQYRQDYNHHGKVVVENYEFPEYEKVKQAVFGEKTRVVYQSTPKPTFASTIRTIARKKLQPVVTTYDSRLTSTPAYVSPTVKSTTAEPIRTYLPVTSTVKITSALPKVKVVEEYVARDYLPSRKYLPVEVTTLSREYLPATEEPEITTLSREYLPARTRLRITTPGSPRIKVARPVTVIKQNDAHPLLSAKLGAQCTCVSNTLRLRKKPRIIVVEEDDDNDDDGYVVDDNVVEAEKVVDITPVPLETQVYDKKRQPVSKVSEVFYKKAVDDKEIAKAVRTGLKLVQQAAKEGTQEALANKQFDRYGPGGVRGKSETLQGTIDCQRAGLFRHPSRCDKFYACRWDCTKNRFTLHVFNCPVHLTFDNSLGACNWPSQGPACVENTLITSD